MRKCGLCNGTGRFYPIDHGPVRECEICDDLGMLKIKKFQARGRHRSAETKPRGSAMKKAKGEAR